METGWDCGVFVCIFADLLSRDAAWKFDLQQMKLYREHIALSLIRGKVTLGSVAPSTEEDSDDDVVMCHDGNQGTRLYEEIEL